MADNPLNIMSLEEFFAHVDEQGAQALAIARLTWPDAPDADFARGMNGNPWIYNPETRVLFINGPAGNWMYEIDLEHGDPFSGVAITRQRDSGLARAPPGEAVGHRRSHGRPAASPRRHDRSSAPRPRVEP